MSNLYEIHHTVAKTVVEDFQSICWSINVKPIMLDLHHKNGQHISDMQTSVKFTGLLLDVIDKAEAIKSQLKNAGLDVIRCKIESTLDNPIVTHKLLKNVYLEAHFEILCNNDIYPLLQDVCPGLDLHLSRNAFKGVGKDGFYTIMATYRSWDIDIDLFKTKCYYIETILGAVSPNVRLIMESVLEDTNVDHDNEWLGRTAKAEV